MKKQIAMIMAAVLAFSNAGSMMAGELIEVEESIVDETIADDSLIGEEASALNEYAAEPAPLPEDIIMAEETPEETAIEEAPGALITEEEPMEEVFVEEDLTEDYLAAEDILIDEITGDNNESVAEDTASEQAELPVSNEEIVVEEGLSDEPVFVGAASGECGENVNWTLNDEGVLTISGTGEMYDYDYYWDTAPWNDKKNDIKIVEVGDGVTRIGKYAFYQCENLSNVDISNTVTNIGENAFDGCTGLSEIVIPSGVTSIERRAFYGCSNLGKVTIPDTVTGIGAAAFAYCTGLQEITIPSGVTSIEESTFEKCSSLSKVTIPNTVTSIGTWAFNSSGLSDITIPVGVKSIGHQCFWGSAKLKNVKIPYTVTDIGGLAFQYCENLTSIEVDAGNSSYLSLDGVLFNKDKTTLIQFPAGKEGSYTVPTEVKTIGKSAFSYSKISEVVLPEGLTTIEQEAFYYAENLTGLIIPESVTTIGYKAFAELSNAFEYIFFKGNAPTFTGVEYSDYIYIFTGTNHVNAYYYTKYSTWTDVVKQDWGGWDLAWIPLDDNDEPVQQEIQTLEINSPGTVNITYRDETVYFSFVPTETRSYHFYTLNGDSNDFKEIQLYDGDFNLLITDLRPEPSLYYELEAGKQYYFRASFEHKKWSRTGSFDVLLEFTPTSGKCGTDLFWAYENDTLTITGTGNYWLSYVYDYTRYAEKIKKVIIGDGVTDIGANAFRGFSNLQEISIPDSVEKIGFGAFQDCSSLSSIILPESLTRIEQWAFVNCGFNEITFPEKVTDIGQELLQGCDKLKKITFEGDAPLFAIGERGYQMQFSGVTARAYYPHDNATWTEEVMKDYGGVITWLPDNILEGSVKASNITLNVDTKKAQSAQIQVTENLSEGALSYSSDNEKVTVDAEGKVTVEAGFSGFATITIKAAATDAYTEASATITVNVLFSDVTDPETQFYYDYVYWAANNGITTGYNDGSFGPLKDCNRAAVVTFLWRMAGKPEPGSMAAFKDMTNNPDFDKAISWALEKGITTGYEKDNTFRPWNPCNRAAIVTFLWRYAGSPEPKAMAAFNDLTNNKDFDKAISWAAENGITTGWQDNTFRPWNTCNRLAVVSFLARYDAL